MKKNEELLTTEQLLALSEAERAATKANADSAQNFKKFPLASVKALAVQDFWARIFSKMTAEGKL